MLRATSALSLALAANAQFTCGDIKTLFRDAECCGAPAGTPVGSQMAAALNLFSKENFTYVMGCGSLSDPVVLAEQSRHMFAGLPLVEPVVVSTSVSAEMLVGEATIVNAPSTTDMASARLARGDAWPYKVIGSENYNNPPGYHGGALFKTATFPSFTNHLAVGMQGTEVADANCRNLEQLLQAKQSEGKNLTIGLGAFDSGSSFKSAVSILIHCGLAETDLTPLRNVEFLLTSSDKDHDNNVHDLEDGVVDLAFTYAQPRLGAYEADGNSWSGLSANVFDGVDGVTVFDKFANVIGSATTLADYTVVLMTPSIAAQNNPVLVKKGSDWDTPDGIQYLIDVISYYGTNVPAYYEAYDEAYYIEPATDENYSSDYTQQEVLANVDIRNIAQRVTLAVKFNENAAPPYTVGQLEDKTDADPGMRPYDSTQLEKIFTSPVDASLTVDLSAMGGDSIEALKTSVTTQLDSQTNGKFSCSYQPQTTDELLRLKCLVQGA